MRRVAIFAALVLALALTGAATAAPESVGRTKAPNITGTTLYGKKLSLSWFRGKAVFVNVWASW